VKNDKKLIENNYLCLNSISNITDKKNMVGSQNFRYEYSIRLVITKEEANCINNMVGYKKKNNI
jgi:hypothetical protein